MSHQRNGDYKTSKDEWETPAWLFELLDKEYDIHADAAATEYNAKKPFFCSDSLNQPWYDGNLKNFFLNPPYSAGNIDRFMKKAYEESLKGAVIVCLVPCATDTKWWHNYVMKAQEIRFIKGRVKFVGYDEKGEQIKNSPTFSSCVVIFKNKTVAEALENPYAPYIGKTIEQPGKVPA